MPTKLVKYIDPPGVWRYGFPKPMPDKVDDLNQWLVDNGYPKSEIEKMGEHFFCRMISKLEEIG